MRSLRLAKQLVFDKLTDTYNELRDRKLVQPEDEIGKVLAKLFNALLDGIELMQDDARVALIVDGVAIPWSDDLAVEILGCTDCTNSSHAQIPHDMLSGVLEDAGEYTCMKHGWKVVEWARQHMRDVPEGAPSVLEIAHLARTLGIRFSDLEDSIRAGMQDYHVLLANCTKDDD
jgi:hypothetical protein